MKCVEIRELLSLYIDKMLDENETREVEEHFSACEDCKKVYNEIKEMVDLLGRAEMIPVPDAFGYRLKKALKEEKRSMIRTGILKRFSDKNRWRLLSSIAAVFAVGILSFGLFHKIIGDLPNYSAGTEQSDMASPGGEPFNTYSGQVEETDGSSDSAMDAEMFSDDSVSTENQSSDMKSRAKALDPDASDDVRSDGSESQNDKAMDRQSDSDSDGGGSQPYTGDKSAPAAAEQEADRKEAAGQGATGTSGAEKEDSPTSEQPAALNGSEEDADSGQEIQEYGGTMPVPEESSRSMTGSGVERSPVTIEHYDMLIEEKLKNFDYQVLSFNFELTGQWKFRIFIFRDKDGNTYNEEITIIGKEGEIEVTASEFMGL